jgi:hypothetical protein
MKKLVYTIVAMICLGVNFSCSDMLETDSSRQTFDPELDQKTDSVFYIYGIMQAMQQLADQYVFTGEMRGDLVKTTHYTDNNLRHLANFTDTVGGKYDSAYVYYRVINNCNYYVAHRDTTLRTGATKVVMNEYVAVKALRAWAYLQLVRIYGKVPFFTQPLTKISQIDDGGFPELDLDGIVSELAPDLEQYTGYETPKFGNVGIGLGSTNSGVSKTMYTAYLCIPVDVILGDLYLERGASGDYAKAVSHYTTYLTQVATTTGNAFAASFTTNRTGSMNAVNELPSDWDSNQISYSSSWSTIFSNNSTQDLITYIPMAVNRLKGTTTSVPYAFGYNYYATAEDAKAEGLRIDKIQIEPSNAFFAISDSCDYYYYATVTGALSKTNVHSVRMGDMRASACVTEGTGDDSTKIWVNKYNSGNIILYRTSTVLMHLAEAFNRLGYYDAAFAILKDGLNNYLIDYANYLSPETKVALTTTYPLLSSAYISKFSNPYNCFGIHTHGSGITLDYNGSSYLPGLSPYRPDTIIGQKMKQIAQKYNVKVGTTKQDSINAMEDVLCDEYALEFAFEGTRFYDLCRMARHKNNSSPSAYGSNFGGKWINKKLKANNSLIVKDLSVQNNWYLPFK